MIRLNSFFKTIRRPDSLEAASATDKEPGETTVVSITHLLTKAHSGYRHIGKDKIDKMRFSRRLQASTLLKS